MVFSRVLSSEVLINASAQCVWSLITGFKDFPSWNPFIRKASGEIKVGSKIKVFIEPPQSKGMLIQPTVIKVDLNHELRWLGRLYLPWLFDGEHAFHIEPAADGTVRFIQSEAFTGLLVPFGGSLLLNTLKGFEEMNKALKQRAEQG